MITLPITFILRVDWHKQVRRKLLGIPLWKKTVPCRKSVESYREISAPTIGEAMHIAEHIKDQLIATFSDLNPEVEICDFGPKVEVINFRPLGFSKKECGDRDAI